MANDILVTLKLYCFTAFLFLLRYKVLVAWVNVTTIHYQHSATVAPVPTPLTPV